MALVKFGNGISNMSGSLAGNTFARNRYGSYVRNRTKPVNPNTDRQADVRTNVSQLANAWSTVLNAAKRGAWDSYAAAVSMLNRLGESVYLSGFNHFIRSNAAIMKAGIAMVEDGPEVIQLPEKDSTLACAGSAATNNLSVTFDNTQAWANEAGGHLLVTAGSPQLATRNYFNGPWRYAGKVDGNATTPPTSPATIASPYTLVAGQKMWVFARVLRADGRLSEPFRCSFTVGA